MTESRCIFSGMQILMNKSWHTHLALVIEKGVIQAIVPEERIEAYLPATHNQFPADHYLLPGLIDLHIHGVNNADVMDGTLGALRNIANTLAAEGMTGFLATTMTAASEQIEMVLKNVAAYAPGKTGAAVLGVHLEGPFISRQKCGAQSPEHILKPDEKLFLRWQQAANGVIKIVTLAPELSNALPFIQALRQQGVLVSIGHTNAAYAEVCEVIRAGCTQATHLFNAMSSIHQREPGAAMALLLSPDIDAELIVDGLHLHPAMVELAWRLKGKDRLLLVTDAMRATCLGDGEFDLGGQAVKVRGNQAVLADGTLAGSTLRMPQAMKNMMQFTGCSLADVICMASFNPARVLKMADHKGSIAVGKDADLVVMDASLNVQMTMRGGEEIFSTIHSRRPPP